MKRKAASSFTLIELLIVVAILGILAAIAVPNLLHAQIRAKVARALADLRTIRAAVDLYRTDHHAVPLSTHPALGDNTIGYLRHTITTPVAYLRTGLLPDPFIDPRDPAKAERSEQFYTYQNMPFNVPRGSFPVSFFDFYGDWRACSYGPDQGYFNGPYGSTIYHPSNGVLSVGNIWVSDHEAIVQAEPVW